MSLANNHKDVFYFCGLLSSSVEYFEIIEAKLENFFGIICLQSQLYKHKYTQYYADEMGSEIYRKFIGFLPLKQPTELKTLKLATNKLEIELASLLNSPFKRPVNLDPGYVDEPRVVLASCKDYNHRIAIGDGVYADLHLVYKRKVGYTGLAWSYPDYTDDVAKQFFISAREILRKKRQKHK